VPPWEDDVRAPGPGEGPELPTRGIAVELGAAELALLRSLALKFGLSESEALRVALVGFAQARPHGRMVGPERGRR
jgi:hypothetical protein